MSFLSKICAIALFSIFTFDTFCQCETSKKRGFAPIAPDFALESLSPNDRLPDTQNKMEEYQACEVKLGWLIYPDEKRVEIYRVGKDKEVLLEPQNLSGEDLMPGLIVELTEIFQPD